MMNQDSYNKIVFDMSVGCDPKAVDVAALLESYEVVHTALLSLCDSGHSIVGYAAFEALFDEQGNQRVELILR